MSMRQGAKDANEDSSRRLEQSSLEEINQRLDTITTLMFKILQRMDNPPQHLWPKQ